MKFKIKVFTFGRKMKKQSSTAIILDSNLGLLSSCFELKKKKKCCKKYKKGKICKKCPKNHA